MKYIIYLIYYLFRSLISLIINDLTFLIYIWNELSGQIDTGFSLGIPRKIQSDLKEISIKNIKNKKN